MLQSLPVFPGTRSAGGLENIALCRISSAASVRDKQQHALHALSKLQEAWIFTAAVDVFLDVEKQRVRFLNFTFE